MIPEISSPLECRAEGRRLIGPAIRYRDISPSHRERFEPGAFTLDNKTRWLNYRHEPDRVLAFTNGGGLELRDSPQELLVSAVLPGIPLADHALAEVRNKKLKGFSVEFRAVDEKMENGLRIIQRAELAGVGLVADPSYSSSQAELRARSGRTLRATIPEGVKLACMCSGGAEVKFAQFAENAISEMLDNAFAKVEAELGNPVIAAFENYSQPLASARRGTVRRAARNAVDIDIPKSSAGDSVLSAAEDAGVIVRPFLSTDSVSVIEGDTAVYSRARVRAFVISSTDQRSGWKEPLLIPTPENVIRSAAPRLENLWL